MKVYVLLAALSLAACTAPKPTAADETMPITKSDFQAPQAALADIAALVKAGNRFTVDLYRKEAGKPGNVILSPVSVAGAFSLVQPGARGDTAKDLARVLGFDAVPEARFADTMGALMGDIETHVAPMPQPKKPPPENSEDYWKLKQDPAADFTIANAGWIKQGFALQPAYSDTLSRAFNAGVTPVDFGKPADAASTINRWVASKTNDRIKDLVSADSIDPDMTRLILTNAVWFKAKWRDEFDPDATQDSDFFGRDGKAMPAKLMNRTEDRPYFKGDGFGAIELAYTNPDFALTVLLPEKKNGLAALEAKWTTAQLLAALDGVQSAGTREVVLTLPKATVDGRFELAKTMKDLGAARAFAPGADFSGMLVTPEPLHIDQVTHVTWFQMDETHTEAAAATSIEMVATSAPLEDETQPVIFRVDHPFLIALRHKPTGAILFLGRVESVKAN